MTARIWEKPKSQSGEVPFFGQSSTREFAASDCADASAVVACILANPGVVPSYDVVNGSTLFIEKYAYREFSGGCWDVTAHYKGVVNTWKLSGDTSGGTRKRYYSLETVAGYDCVTTGGIVPFYDQAIGVTDTGIEGVDVPDPKFDFSIEQTLQLSTLSANYLDTLRLITGCVNDELYSVSYLGQNIFFEAEELRFMGITFGQDSALNLTLTYKFSAQRSITLDDGETIGDSESIEAAGWQYVWVAFKQETDSVNHTVRRIPKAAYVERVHKLADFNDLAL